MKLPKKINVKGREYKIQMVGTDKIGSNWGQCNVQDGIISINNSAKGRMLRITFLHEYMHALLCELGIDQAISAQLNEILAEGIASSIDNNFMLRLRK